MADNGAASAQRLRPQSRAKGSRHIRQLLGSDPAGRRGRCGTARHGNRGPRKLAAARATAITGGTLPPDIV